MAGREPIEVSVETGEGEVTAGTLWVHDRGGQTATFRYADSYLAGPESYDLDPALPRSSGVFHTPPGKAMFNAFADSAPDRWGENLMRRQERERARAIDATPRTLGKADFLLGVRDDARQGAIRFRRPGSASYYSVEGWEEIELRLARRAGIDVAASELVQIAGRHVLVVDLRNHAFPRTGRGWALSPAYDLNPNPDNPARLSTAIDLDDTSASIENALSVSRYFRLTIGQARTLVAEVAEATSGWRREAEQLGLPRQQIDRMADAFETDQRRIARLT